MNKVASIEIAGQVFWIDEEAYEILQAYLQKIRRQLAGDESAKDIFKDIELRIAELFYVFNSDAKKAIGTEQLEEVIGQVGFIDGEDTDEEMPRKSYLDPRNKILGGVCAGLAVRLGVPAFILRFVFLALTALFGLGIALYLIFWISLDTNTNRNAALAAQGKAQTARRIATFEAPKESGLAQFQRVIFLPVSILGALATVFGNHFRNRSRGYLLIIKNIIAIALLLVVLFLCAGLFELNYKRLFPWPITWLLSAAAMYLLVLGLAIYVRDFYLTRPNFKIRKVLKTAALIPIVMIVAAITYLNYTISERRSDLVERSFALNGRQLALKFNEQRPLQRYADTVRIHIQTNPAANDQVKLQVHYVSYGPNGESAKDNIRTIDYFFTFAANTLELDKYWSLQEGALLRGQDVNVLIEIPQNIVVTSSLPLTINRDERPYRYSASKRQAHEVVYLSSGQYLHERGDEFSHKLSRNERNILEDKFCEEFFISESWRCLSNIQQSVSENSRFDRAFQKDAEIVDKLREYLLPDRSLFVSSLAEMNELASGLSIEYPVMSKFQEYLERLLIVKSAPQSAPDTDTG